MGIAVCSKAFINTLLYIYILSGVVYYIVYDAASGPAIGILPRKVIIVFDIYANYNNKNCRNCFIYYLNNKRDI